MLGQIGKRLFAICVTAMPIAVSAQATEGEMFGLRIGEQLETYDSSDLILEWFSLPYIEINSDQMAEEFSELQVLVTPISGTILGFRAVAKFDAQQPARAFAERLRNALTAQFGASILCFIDPGPNFHKHPCNTTEGALPRFSDFREIDLYAASIAEYDLSLNLYGTSGTSDGGPEVQLSFAVAEDTLIFASLIERFNQEAEKFDAAARDALLELERAGVLRGIE